MPIPFSQLRTVLRGPMLVMVLVQYGSAIAACVSMAAIDFPADSDPVSFTPVLRVLAAVIAVVALVGLSIAQRTQSWRPLSAMLVQVIFVGLVALNPACWPFAMTAAALWFMCIYSRGRNHIWGLIAQLGGLTIVGLTSSVERPYWYAVAALGAIGITKMAGVEVIIGQVGKNHMHYRNVVEGVRAIVWSTTTDSNGVVQLSDNAGELLGYASEDWVRPGFLADICYQNDSQAFDRLIAEARRVGGNREATIRLKRIDGSVVHMLTRVLTSQSESSNSLATAEGLFVDITRRVEAETQLRRFAEVTNHSPIGCAVVHIADLDDPASGTISFGNPVALRLLRISDLDLAKGIAVNRLFQPSTADLLGRVLTSVARSGNPMSAERMAFPEHPGAYFNIRADRLSDGTVAVTFEDVTARVRTDERLRHQALHDALTGLPNRVQLDEALQDAVQDADRLGRRVALLLMDLTQFKEVNDAMGHRAGDQLLVDISARLSQQVSGHVQLLARLGGDEFALLTPPITGQDEAVALARLALEALERPFEVDGVPVQSMANIGVALCPDHGVDAADLLKMADIAMYRAKRTGQGFEVYSTESDQSSLRRVTLLGELRRAMAAGQLQLHYQPAIDLRTGQVAKVEALVRWNHQHHGLMLPQEFIEMAETSGMIHPLTRWIIVEAGRGANLMHDADLPLVVSANISVKNLQDPDLVSFFELLIRTDNFRPERLELEITETELMDDPVRAFEVLDRLRLIGLSAAIDDFGIGHSSLSYLRHMPVNHLKIDRGFITAITSDPGDAAIVKSTIDLAHSLGLKVTAEGVPNEETLRMLAGFGCDYACGFYLSEAVSYDELAATVQRLNVSAPIDLRLSGPTALPAGAGGAVAASSADATASVSE